MKYALCALCLVASLAFANGSEQGHNNGNGHDHTDTHSTTESHVSVSQSVAADVAVSSSNRVVNSVDAGDASATVSVSQGGSYAVSGTDVKEAAASSASLIAGLCQSGISGQGKAGGIAVLNTDQFCDYLRLAEFEWQAYQRAVKMGCSRQSCSVNCSPGGFVSAEMDVCPINENAQRHYARYEKYIGKASNLLDATEMTATADRVAGQLIRPLMLVALLALL